MPARIQGVFGLFVITALLMSASLSAAEDCGSYDDCGNRYFLVGSGGTIGAVAVTIGTTIGYGLYAKCDGTGFREYSSRFKGVFKTSGDACGELYIIFRSGDLPDDQGACSDFGHKIPVINTKCGKEG